MDSGWGGEYSPMLTIWLQHLENIYPIKYFSETEGKIEGDATAQLHCRGTGRRQVIQLSTKTRNTTMDKEEQDSDTKEEDQR